MGAISSKPKNCSQAPKKPRTRTLSGSSLVHKSNLFKSMSTRKNRDEAVRKSATLQPKRTGDVRGNSETSESTAPVATAVAAAPAVAKNVQVNFAAPTEPTVPVDQQAAFEIQKEMEDTKFEEIAKVREEAAKVADEVIEKATEEVRKQTESVSPPPAPPPSSVPEEMEQEIKPAESVQEAASPEKVQEVVEEPKSCETVPETEQESKPVEEEVKPSETVEEESCKPTEEVQKETESEPKPEEVEEVVSDKPAEEVAENVTGEVQNESECAPEPEVCVDETNNVAEELVSEALDAGAEKVQEEEEKEKIVEEANTEPSSDYVEANPPTSEAFDDPNEVTEGAKDIEPAPLEEGNQEEVPVEANGENHESIGQEETNGKTENGDGEKSEPTPTEGVDPIAAMKAENAENHEASEPVPAQE